MAGGGLDGGRRRAPCRGTSEYSYEPDCICSFETLVPCQVRSKCTSTASSPPRCDSPPHEWSPIVCAYVVLLCMLCI